MLSSVALFAIILIGLTSGFAYIIAQTSINEIMGQWDKRRCDLGPLFAAHVFKPKDDQRSSMEFSIDNFNFCARRIVQDVLKLGFAPLYGIIGQQLNGMTAMSGVMNNIRGALGKSWRTFSILLEEKYKVFISTFIQFKRVYSQLESAMNRIGAMSVSMVYMILSTMTGMLNMYDLVVKVVLIILAILVAIIIILFLFLFPVVPIVLSVIGALVAAGLGAAVGGMAGAFCIDPKAMILMADGSQKRLSEIVVGDILASKKSGGGSAPNRVEGVLEVESESIDLYSIDGILMSGEHRVFYCKNEDNYNEIPIFVKDHPNAVLVSIKKNRLICLNTTNHSIPCVGLTRIVYASDWQEIDDFEEEKKYLECIWTILNKSLLDKNKELQSAISSNPTADGLISPFCYVKLNTNQVVPLGTVIIGDILENSERVLGIYNGSIQTTYLNPEWISDAVWVFDEITQTWELFKDGIKHNSNNLLHRRGILLVTDTGKFTVYCNAKAYTVRDFTEVGFDKISLTYALVDEMLQKKVTS